MLLAVYYMDILTLHEVLQLPEQGDVIKAQRVRLESEINGFDAKSIKPILSVIIPAEIADYRAESLPIQIYLLVQQGVITPVLMDNVKYINH